MGMCFVLVAFGIISNVAYDRLLKENATSTTTVSPIYRPMPQPPPQQQQFGPQSRATNRASNAIDMQSYLLSTDSVDFWIILVAILGAGILIVCLGFLCSNFAICCCTIDSRPSSVRPADDKDWSSS